MSYQKAVEMGHKILLCDIRITADGAMVCVHDDDISKVHAYKNGSAVAANTVLISQTNIADLLTYDFGAYKGHNDLQVLRLEDFMQFCAETEGITPCLEIKEDELTTDEIDYIVGLVKENGFEKNIMFVANEAQNKAFAQKLPYSVVGDWVYSITDTVINRVASYGSETNGRFIYVAKDGNQEYTINQANYVKCKKKNIDIGFTYIADKYPEYFKELKDNGIFNYCKYIALDEPSWLYE